MVSQDYEQYQGRILRVDLSRREVKKEKVDQNTLRQCLGGACLGAKLLYDEVPPGVGWADSDNRLIIASGPLGATAIPGSSTITVATKGALTEGAALTQANGFFGAFLRLCGYDAIIVQGKTNKLSYVYIHNDGEAELRDATSLAGKDTWETGDLISDELGVWPLAWVSIGPAGENLVRFAGIFSDKGHAAAHNGVGAVMGSKNLKAIVAAEGSIGVPVKDGARLLQLVEEMHQNIKSGDTGSSTYHWGTLTGLVRGAEADTLPVKNYTTNIFDIDKEKLDRYRGPDIRSHFSAVRTPCWCCPMHHTHVLKIPEGPYKGELMDEPEYEGFAAWSSVTGQVDVTWTVVLSNFLDRLGMDTNEAAWLVGLVMECYEKGILTLEDTDGLDMTWGNGEATVALLKRIANREGFGNILAEGVMRAARSIGGEAPNMAVHTMKGNSPRGHDHRIAWSEMFDTCISNTGTLESGRTTRSSPLSHALGLPSYDSFSPEEVSSSNAQLKGGMLFDDSMGTCRFTTQSDVPLLLQLLEAVVGWKLSLEEAMQIGQRAANRLRVFNLRHGISAELDRPSPRYGSTLTDGPLAGTSIMPFWDEMLRNYYQKMGWDSSGQPLPETLRSLGLEDLIPHLQGK